MATFEIPMIPDGDGSSAYRTKLAPGETFQTLLMNQGNHGSAVKARGKIVKVATGTMTPNGDPATLLVFEFQFQTPKIKRRFTSAEIILEFEDAAATKNKTHNHTLDPVVHKIVPHGDFALNMETTTSSSTQSFNAQVNGGWQGLVGGSIGYNWELKKDIVQEHYTSLSGTPSNQRKEGYGEDNAAIWWLDEDPETKGGIPKWLRTAVLLRRTHPGPFCVSLIVKTGVDILTDIVTFWGIGQTEAIDPVTVDSELKLNTEDDATVLANMSKLNMVECAKVAFLTPVDTEK
jgi:hypothetical protein